MEQCSNNNYLMTVLAAFFIPIIFISNVYLKKPTAIILFRKHHTLLMLYLRTYKLFLLYLYSEQHHSLFFDSIIHPPV